MALALNDPDRVHDIVSVDNAPVDAPIGREFAKYVEGMKKVKKNGVKSLKEADAILQDYEEASSPHNYPNSSSLLSSRCANPACLSQAKVD